VIAANTVLAVFRRACIAAFGCSLAACTTPPVTPADERLDTNTGTTLTLMPRAVELVSLEPRGGQSDPFAYLGPFETNRMGERALFLWISAPEEGAGAEPPRVRCDDALLPLVPLAESLRSIGLSAAPYTAPAPWSAQWYFRMPEEALECLSGAHRLTIETLTAGGVPERFAAGAEGLQALAQFAARLGQ